LKPTVRRRADTRGIVRALRCETIQLGASPPRQTTAGRLNLGCGTDVRAGYVNLDAASLPGVDVVHDLDVLPLPFEDGAFREIVCQDVLEHVDLVGVLRECHRILVPGGVLSMRSPHFSSAAAHIDPTHRRAFSIETLDFFASEGRFANRGYYFDFRFSRLASARIAFHRYRWQPWNYLVEPLVNASPATQRYYEGTCLARLFPAANVEVVLVK
jgi:SAM-dependent methyltransferase